MNLAKCSALPINIPPHISTNLKDSFSIVLTDNTLQYLGLRLAPSLRAMYNANYPQAFLKTKQWLQLWSTFPISLLGRVVTIKMSILPKLLYLFRALPLYVPRQTINLIQRAINKFIWKNKSPSYGKLLTHRPLSQGGLGLPNICLYYLSVRLAQAAQWHAPPALILWLQFEIISALPFYVPGLPWQTELKPREIGMLNNIVGQIIHLWNLYHQKFTLRSDRPLLS